MKKWRGFLFFTTRNEAVNEPPYLIRFFITVICQQEYVTQAIFAWFLLTAYGATTNSETTEKPACLP